MTAKRLAWALALLALTISVTATAISLTDGNRLEIPWAPFNWTLTLVFIVAGHVIATRQPRNPIGWLLLTAGLFFTIAALAGAYADYWLETPAGSDALGHTAAWYSEVSWMPFILVPATFLLLLFPDGRLLSPRWRPIAWSAGVGIAGVFLSEALRLGPIADYPELNNPIGVSSVLLEVLEPFAMLAFVIGMAGAVVSVILRFRRSDGEQRQQLKWIAFAGAVAAVTLVIMIALYDVVGARVADGSIMLAILGLPAATAVAILRYRLYDIDIVINKTVVLAVLAGFITAVYAGIVVGLGRLLAVGDRDFALAIAATALIAVAFEPVRARVQHWANRLVYGRRATPYEALAAMTGKLGEADDPNFALQEAARLLAEGTGAAQAVVWVADAGVLVPRATSGSADAETTPLRLNGNDLPELDGALVRAVRHEGELVGALSLAKRPGEGLSSADRRLVEEFAGQAALLLANTRLRARLTDRLEELRTSRQRMLAAHDQARHALERDLHDGAQQELVALKVGLGLVTMIAEDEGATAVAARLPDAVSAANAAVVTLRDVARGIYPPLLASGGLAAAVKAQARPGDLAVTVLDRSGARYSPEIEATGFFCIREALANVTLHADTDEVRVELGSTDSGLSIVISDEGAGFDTELVAPGDGLTHMCDRADAQGGTLAIASRPSVGTTITLTLPTQPERPPRQDGH